MTDVNNVLMRQVALPAFYKRAAEYDLPLSNDAHARSVTAIADAVKAAADAWIDGRESQHKEAAAAAYLYAGQAAYDVAGVRTAAQPDAGSAGEFLADDAVKAAVDRLIEGQVKAAMNLTMDDDSVPYPTPEGDGDEDEDEEAKKKKPEPGMVAT